MCRGDWEWRKEMFSPRALTVACATRVPPLRRVLDFDRRHGCARKEELRADWGGGGGEERAFVLLHTDMWAH